MSHCLVIVALTRVLVSTLLYSPLLNPKPYKKDIKKKRQKGKKTNIQTKTNMYKKQTNKYIKIYTINR
jgi:hypothetical protein